MWNQKLFDLIAGVAVFIAVTLLLEDVYPPLAWGILIAAFGYMLLTYGNNVGSFIENYRSALGKA